MALAPLSQTIFLTEDGSTPIGEKAVTIPPMGIAPSITLGTLTLSAPIVSGTPSSGTIVGASEGSFIADSVPGLTIDSPARTYAWDGSGPVASYPVGLTEAHPDATNSGRTSPVTIAAAIVKVGITGTPPTSGQTGVDYSFVPGTTNGAGTKVFSKNRTLLVGQTFSTTTGAIGGKPTEAGTITGLIVTVTDATGSASTMATTVVVAPAGGWGGDGPWGDPGGGWGGPPIQNFGIESKSGIGEGTGGTTLVQNFGVESKSGVAEGSTGAAQNFGINSNVNTQEG